MRPIRLLLRDEVGIDLHREMERAVAGCADRCVAWVVPACQQAVAAPSDGVEPFLPQACAHRGR